MKNERLIPSPQELCGLPADTPVLLGFSGGADSTLLLHLLAVLSRENGFPLLALHVNHGIRGDEALRDREFCRAAAEREGVELLVIDADVPVLARQHGRGLEEEAREVRYAAFDTAMRERGIPILVTAHHADDNMETVLFRMARGTDPKGLCGIRQVREFGGGFLVRPLLGMTRERVLTLCGGFGLAYVTDSSNSDEKYARNRIRANAAPVLTELYPDAPLRVRRLTERLAEDCDYLDSEAERIYRNFRAQDRRGTLPVALWTAAHPAIRRRLLSLVFSDACGGSAENVHLDALADLLEHPVPNRRVTLPDAIYAVIENGALCFVSVEPAGGGELFLPFCAGQEADFGSHWKISAQKSGDGAKVHNLSTANGLFSSAVSVIMKPDCFWRCRRPGDVIFLHGMHRKVRRLWEDAKIPARLREDLPLLCDGEGIVWAPFCGVREGFSTEREAREGEPVTLTVTSRDLPAKS